MVPPGQAHDACPGGGPEAALDRMRPGGVEGHPDLEEAGVMARYHAVIDKDPDREYGVGFPDFPGCFSGGRTVGDGAPLPTPKSLEEVLADPQ